MPGEARLGGRRPSERQREFDAIIEERDECCRRMQDAEKKLAAMSEILCQQCSTLGRHG